MLEFISIQPDDILPELAHLPFPWWIGSGWAIELYVGSYVRDHHDIDIAILRSDHRKLYTELSGWEFKIAKDGALYEWNGSELDPDIHTLWSRKKGDDKWLAEFMINESSSTEWIFRKDKKIRCPLREIGMKASNAVPYLRPAIPLLYKSAHCLDKDTIDFRAALPLLTKDEKARLKNWITAFKPECQWLQEF